MKTFRVICAATVLALSLSIPAYAGDAHEPGKPCTSELPTDQESGRLPADVVATVVDALWTAIF
jgi:hypothetical protein